MIYQVAYNFHNFNEDEMPFFDYLKSIADDYYHVTNAIFWIYSEEGLDVHKVTKHISENFGKIVSFVICPIDGHDVNGWVGESANKWREEYKYLDIKYE